MVEQKVLLGSEGNGGLLGLREGLPAPERGAGFEGRAPHPTEEPPPGPGCQDEIRGLKPN